MTYPNQTLLLDDNFMVTTEKMVELIDTTSDNLLNSKMKPIQSIEICNLISGSGVDSIGAEARYRIADTDRVLLVERDLGSRFCILAELPPELWETTDLGDLTVAYDRELVQAVIDEALDSNPDLEPEFGVWILTDPHFGIYTQTQIAKTIHATADWNKNAKAWQMLELINR